MPSARPFIWALEPATARPSVRAASRSKPKRSATTAAQRVRTGARLTRIVRPCVEALMPMQPGARQEVASVLTLAPDRTQNAVWTYQAADTLKVVGGGGAGGKEPRHPPSRVTCRPLISNSPSAPAPP